MWKYLKLYILWFKTDEPSTGEECTYAYVHIVMTKSPYSRNVSPKFVEGNMTAAMCRLNKVA